MQNGGSIQDVGEETSLDSGMEFGPVTMSHLQMPGSASTVFARLLGTTKLATSIRAATIPNILAVLVFIIPPKFSNPETFAPGTFGEFRPSASGFEP
jgi:hypothetical protein